MTDHVDKFVVSAGNNRRKLYTGVAGVALIGAIISGHDSLQPAMFFSVWAIPHPVPWTRFTDNTLLLATTAP